MGNPHRETAVTALVEEDWSAAGDAYTRAAHRDLGETEEWSVLDPGSRERPAFGLGFLLQAALCYRLAGVDARARLRSLTVQPLAIDGRDHIRTGHARAVYQEFVADARAVLGETDRAATEYDRAAALYREHAPDDPLTAAGKPLFSAANRPLMHFSRNTGLDVEWDDLHGSDPESEDYLAYRAEYKQSHFPRVVEAVLDAGKLHVPRGTTEYNNETYRCPDCGETDVNWIAGETVCLYCSVRVEERDAT
jgi:hypothetical protein